MPLDSYLGVFRKRRTLAVRKYVPVLGTLVLLCVMYGIGIANYEGFYNTQILLNILSTTRSCWSSRSA